MTRQGWTVTSPLESERFAWLDTISAPVQKGWHALFRANQGTMLAKNALNGVPWRHRVHPAIIILPLGAWTTAALLDTLDGFASRNGESQYWASADAAVAFGLVSAVPAVLSGWADWVDQYGHQRRVGMAHALTNITAIALYAASMGLRTRGPERRKTARALAGLGYVIVSTGGALGGEMVYNLGVNIPHVLYPKAPIKWAEVLGSEELPEGTPVVVDFERVPVLLLRHEGNIYAVESWCPHAGGPLNEGTFEGRMVECPWHQSRFDLRDGHPVQGPAATLLRTFEVREVRGRISVKPSYEAEDWPPAPAPPAEHPTLAPQ
ncbi:MAG: Rieske 2Fe-2S domain-containing protein [Chloroflexota bacterium]|nr:Rieske 2Fe-2S domain-containing protein [Chloroflexota bacterium]